MRPQAISPSELRRIVRYEPETGRFIWLVKTAKKVIVGTEVGCLRDDGYRVARLYGQLYFLHRLAWFYMTGQWPKQIDHRNHNPSDNRWTNLRISTHSQNAFNQPGWSRLGKNIRHHRNRYQVVFYKDGKSHHIGIFKTIADAVAARDEAAINLHGEFAWGKNETNNPS